MKSYIFIQARMGSTRLPGKVLKPLAGKSQLKHLVDRLGKYKTEGNITVVTSDLSADDAIENFCKMNSINCFRGSELDVLDRFYRAGLAINALADDCIVRVTADCPLHHEEVITFAVNEFQKLNVDYFSNSFPPDYEDGCDTEVFLFSALEMAHRNAKLVSQREHVTPYIKDSGLFHCAYKKFNADYKYKLSVDTIEDHAAVDNIFNAFAPNTNFTISEVVQLLNSKPELLLVNKNSIINAGYAKSLKNDKEIE